MLQAAYYPWIGGAELFAQKVAEYMVKNGHQVDMVTGLWETPDVLTEKWNSSEENINGVNVYRVKGSNIRYIKTMSAILPMYKKSVELMKKNNYDLIHAHIFPAMVSGAMLKKKFKKPLLITVQGGDLVDYKETTAAFGGILKPVISYSLRKADLVHGVSNHTAKRAESLGAKKTVVVPNGVDENIFFPQTEEKEDLRKKYGFKKEDKIIVSSSRLTPKNGMHLLIEAVKNGKDKIKNLKLVIIGDGDQREKLENLINKWSLKDIVFLFGYKPNTEMPSFMNMSDVFCRPSLDEGFGISFIEAMACGALVIGSNTGGIPDIITDKENGFLVMPCDIFDLQTTLEKVFNLNKTEIEKTVKNGFKTINEKFRWEIVQKQMEKTYNSLI